jgi:hypothetical protein
VNLQFAVKQFIRNVRAAKTIADERAVVQKESAAIRASFREESGDHNVRFLNSVHFPRTLLDINGLVGETTLPNYFIFSRWENEPISAR